MQIREAQAFADVYSAFIHYKVKRPCGQYKFDIKQRFNASNMRRRSEFCD